MLKGLRVFNTKSTDVDRLYQNVSKFARQFTDNPILDGILIADQALLSSGVTSINHRLGRDIRGWVVVNKTAESDIWAVAANQTRPSKTLELSCSANVTVSLYVF